MKKQEFIKPTCNCDKCGAIHENHPRDVMKNDANLIFFNCHNCRAWNYIHLINGPIHKYKHHDPNSQWVSGSKAFYERKQRLMDMAWKSFVVNPNEVVTRIK